MDTRLLEYDRHHQTVDFDPKALATIKEVLNDFKVVLKRIFKPPKGG